MHNHTCDAYWLGITAFIFHRPDGRVEAASASADTARLSQSEIKEAQAPQQVTMLGNSPVTARQSALAQSAARFNTFSLVSFHTFVLDGIVECCTRKILCTHCSQDSHL